MICAPPLLAVSHRAHRRTSPKSEGGRGRRLTTFGTHWRRSAAASRTGWTALTPATLASRPARRTPATRTAETTVRRERHRTLITCRPFFTASPRPATAFATAFAMMPLNAFVLLQGGGSCTATLCPAPIVRPDQVVLQVRHSSTTRNGGLLSAPKHCLSSLKHCPSLRCCRAARPAVRHLQCLVCVSTAFVAKTVPLVPCGPQVPTVICASLAARPAIGGSPAGSGGRALDGMRMSAAARPRHTTRATRSM